MLDRDRRSAVASSLTVSSVPMIASERRGSDNGSKSWVDYAPSCQAGSNCICSFPGRGLLLLQVPKDFRDGRGGVRVHGPEVLGRVLQLPHGPRLPVEFAAPTDPADRLSVPGLERLARQPGGFPPGSLSPVDRLGDLP